MAEYIERDECRDNFYASVLSILSGDSTNDRANQIIDEFDTLPAADVEPVTHAEWEYDGADRRCSNCGAIVEEDEWFNHNWYYCYHCGAKMGGEENGRYKKMQKL